MNAPTYDRTRVGELCVITSAVLFGLMPLFAKIAAEHGSNAYMSALGRFFFGSVVLLAVLAAASENTAAFGIVRRHPGAAVRVV